MSMNLYKRQYGTPGINVNPAFCNKNLEAMPSNEKLPEFPTNIKSRCESQYAWFILLHNNHIRFATKAFMPVFREIPINGFIAARNYNDHLSIERIDVTDEKLYVYCGLYLLKFSLPYFHHISTELVDDGLAIISPGYQVAIVKMVNYIGDTSRSNNKKRHFIHLLKLLAHKHYEAARKYATHLLSDHEFVKALFFTSKAKILVNEFLDVTNHFSFSLANIPEPTILNKINKEAEMESDFPEIAFLDFPKKKYIRPSEKKMFIQLVDEVIQLARNGENFIPKIQTWFNLFMIRQEWVLNDICSKEAGEITFAHEYGSLDTGKYKLLYQQLYQYISYNKRNEFITLLTMKLESVLGDVTALCNPDHVVNMKGRYDIEDYVARLGPHIEDFICVF